MGANDDELISQAWTAATAEPVSMADMIAMAGRLQNDLSAMEVLEIKTASEDAVRRWAAAMGVPVRPWTGAVSLFGVPIRIDDRMVPGTVMIGDRLYMIDDHDVLYVLDLRAAITAAGRMEEQIVRDLMAGARAANTRAIHRIAFGGL